MTAFMAYLERKSCSLHWCPFQTDGSLMSLTQQWLFVWSCYNNQGWGFWFHWEYGVSVELAQDVCRVWIYTGLPDTATIQLSPLFLCMPPDNSRTIFNREETEPDSVVIGYFWMHSSWCTMGAVWPTISGTTKNIFPQWQIYCNY